MASLTPDMLDALQSLIGGSAGPGMRANDPVKLASLRRDQESEMAHNLDVAREFPGQVYSGATPSDLRGLHEDIASDPYTGDAATALSEFMGIPQTQARAQKAHEAADLAGATAHNQALGKGIGEAEASTSPAGMEAGDIASKRKINELTAPIDAKLGMSAGGPVSPMIDNLAKEFAKNPAYPIPPDLKDAVVAHAAATGALNGPQTNQSKARMEAAKVALPQIPELLSKAAELNDSGWFNPVTGRIRHFLVSSGFGLPGDDQLTGKMSNFETQLGLLVSQLQNIHAGARGAASQDLRKAFDALVNGRGSLPEFQAQMAAVHELMSRYANGNTEDEADPWAAPPTAAELAGGR